MIGKSIWKSAPCGGLYVCLRTMYIEDKAWLLPRSHFLDARPLELKAGGEMTHPLVTRRNVLAAMTLGVTASAWPYRRAHALRLADRGPAPEFAGISAWLWSPPPPMARAPGPGVLIDFWTHTRSNWLP